MTHPTTGHVPMPELLVKLPAELAQLPASLGYSGSTPNEDRFQARLDVRRQAAVEFDFTPLAILEEVGQRPGFGAVLLKDMSKVGVALVYHEQLYPTERAKIHFQGRVLKVTIQRCRRVAEMCYEAGARIDSVESI